MKRVVLLRLMLLFVGPLAVAAIACSGASSQDDSAETRLVAPSPDAASTPDPVPALTPTPEPKVMAGPRSDTAPDSGPTTEAKASPTPDPEPHLGVIPQPKRSGSRPDVTPTPFPHLDSRGLPRFIWMRDWSTDFSKNKINLREILLGGPPRNGIPPINDPNFHDVAQAPAHMKDDEPVVSLEIGGDARAYPLSILLRHEVANDEVGGTPVTITYCPLCNTAIVFDRRVGGRTLEFGVSGMLRRSDLIMWDVETESWWQQITGEAIVGELTGTRLRFIPATLVSWREFREAFPDGRLLSRNTGADFDYDRVVYAGYDNLENDDPAFFVGDPDPRLPAMERVVAVEVDGVGVAYPFALLQEHPVINDSVNGLDLALFYTGSTLSPFAQYTASFETGFKLLPNRAVGSVGVYEPFVDGEKFTFRTDDNAIVDEQTGSSWNTLGQAVDGPLQGSELSPVVHGDHFWFAWAAFRPDTAIRTAEDFPQ